MAPRRTDSCSWKKGHKDSLWTMRKPDSEPLLRFDLQWQLLDHIFSDRTVRFTAPVDSNGPSAEPIYLNFDQLYLEAILSSMKTNQNLRAKLIENPQFATNFSKVALLVNIGRINTTLAFYPSMKTAMRTYHPIPSLQTDETSKKDLSDAPRIKGILKASLLDWEMKQQPSCLQDIAKKLISPELTRGPPTTVITAIFHLFNEAIWVTDKYFQGCDLLDIFYPSNLPSAPRARAFLTLMHHVLEDKSFINDFATDGSSGPPFVALSPPINFMLPPPTQSENIDTPEELAYVQEMKEVRQGVVKTVPGIQKREEELNLKNAARKAEVQGEDGVAAPAGKRQKLGRGRSNAAMQRDAALAARVPEILPPGWEDEDWSRDVPTRSSLPLTWSKVKRDMELNRDPDYDSDEEEAWSYDLLLRRKLLTVVDPRTGSRGPVTDIKDHEEWIRRKQTGYVPEDEEEEVGLGAAKAEELEGDDDDD